MILLLLRFTNRQNQYWHPVYLRTKGNKKRPCKGSLRLAVKKVSLAACSTSTLAQRPGCYFHLHRVYTIKLLTVLLCLLGIFLTAYLSRRLENITTSFFFIYNHIYLNVFLMLFGYLLESLKHFYSPL